MKQNLNLLLGFVCLQKAALKSAGNYKPLKAGENNFKLKSVVLTAYRLHKVVNESI